MYDIIWFILIYSLIGWVLEVSFAACVHGKFVNRGFLSGPVCPIYGFGVAIVYLMLKPLAHTWIWLFLGSAILTSLLEYITGYVLEKMFGQRWWDYSDMKFNLNGYICLEFSIVWGVVCVFAVKVLFPLTDMLINIVPFVLGVVLEAVFGIIMLADIVYTTNRVLGFNRDMKRLKALSDALEKNSCKIGEAVAENTLEAREKLEETKEKIEESKEKFEENNKDKILAAREKIEETKEKYKETKERYDEALKGFSAKYKRILTAFPKLKSKKYQQYLNDVKNKLGNIKRK